MLHMVKIGSRVQTAKGELGKVSAIERGAVLVDLDGGGTIRESPDDLSEPNVKQLILSHVQKAADPLTAMQLADILGESIATTAKTLVELKESGLVAPERRGDNLVYVLAAAN